MPTLTAPTGDRQTRYGLLLFVCFAGTVGTALFFEHVLGYMPCRLCLAQRVPYYAGLMLMAAAIYGAGLRWPSWLLRVFFAATGLLMLYGLAIAIFHAGVEWAFWPAPASCTAVGGAADTGGKGILDALDVIPPSCDKAPWRFLGLSFAGWNVPASLIFAIGALRAGLMRQAD